MNRLRKALMRVPRTRWGKQTFLLLLRGKKAKILDVGCGNNSPTLTKQLCPDAYYVGVDVGNYNNSPKSIALADEYQVFQSERFAEGIRHLNGSFDAVISSHNLEHCNHPEETLKAMCAKLKSGGKLFLSFPNSESVHFPHREGTLNFYDDPTHIYVPEMEQVLKWLKKEGMQEVKAIKGYQPLYYWIMGGGYGGKEPKAEKGIERNLGFLGV